MTEEEIIEGLAHRLRRLTARYLRSRGTNLVVPNDYTMEQWLREATELLKFVKIGVGEEV